jgi:hypothetical protein
MIDINNFIGAKMKVSIKNIAAWLGFDRIQKRRDNITGRDIYVGYNDGVGIMICYASDIQRLKKKYIKEVRDNHQMII